MLKLLIADDERAIRESISSLIDWKALGIELIGTVKDGIEAYNAILDLYPDIVMTDIKMPGLSGLELIQKIYEINKDTQFIILSGYHEFEYAKTAMQYGVKHYLLKPCSEKQIVQSILEIQEDFNRKQITQHIVQEHFLQKQQLYNSLMINIINHYLARTPDDPIQAEEDYFTDYRRHFCNLDSDYDVFYLYFIEEDRFEQVIRQFSAFWSKNYPGILLNLVYVHNTLLFFFQSFAPSYTALEGFLESCSLKQPHTTPVLQHTSFSGLIPTLHKISAQISRYEKIYYSSGQGITVISNANNILRNLQDAINHLFDPSADSAQEFSVLEETIRHIYDLDFLRQITPSFIITAVSRFSSAGIADSIAFLADLDQESEIDIYKEKLLGQIELLYTQRHTAAFTGDVSDRIKRYVQEHISNPDLSLKWIAENELYMNVDYLSKKFVRETGMKFSSYLTGIRIQKAKELMSCANPDTIQNIAEMVGCGNNPQYFSQIFKKGTGKSPSQYMKLLHS